MRAISVHQPWAWLIIEGYKPVENRSRHCRIRERVAIHASKKFNRSAYDYVRTHFPHIEMPDPRDFILGAVIGSVEVTDSVTEMDDPFYCGPIGWKLERPHPLRTPIRWKASQGWFKVPSLDGLKIRIPDRIARELKERSRQQCRSAKGESN